MFIYAYWKDIGYHNKELISHINNLNITKK